MNAPAVQLAAGGLLGVKAEVDKDATEQIVARTYHHPALGNRPVIRLASDRLGEAEDVAMDFFGFQPPEVSKPLAVQRRSSLGFSAWALVNDPGNAHYALDLVKRMKAAARRAKPKPGHAWDAYVDMSKELGRSARHFLPPYWEEVGRTYKDLGNHTYAGRALNKSLEAERVHGLDFDRERRRDVVLEFALAGCLSGKALAEYAADLVSQYSVEEAFWIFRDLCVRRTRGGMAPWAAMPKDFLKMAKAAGLGADEELEKWLEEVIETPAMGRVAHQFWKTCQKHCERVVAGNPAFAVALLRHTKPDATRYGDSGLEAWLDLLEAWGVLEFLWEDEHRGAPPLGESVAVWFGRVVRDRTPVPTRVFEMLEKLVPRLKKEGMPLPLVDRGRFFRGRIDIDLLESCLVLGIKVDDPPDGFAVTFDGWLVAEVEHPYRNQDIVESAKDERFKSAIIVALEEALACRGGSFSQGWNRGHLQKRAFPLAANDRPGIKQLWHSHTSGVIAQLEASGLASFEEGRTRLEATLWPETLRLFGDLAERLNAVDPDAMLRRTLQAGVIDEYGWPTFEAVVDKNKIQIRAEYCESNISLTFPNIVVTDKVHAYVVGGDGTIGKHELRLPKKCTPRTVVVIGDDLAVGYHDNSMGRWFYWASDPTQKHPSDYGFEHDRDRMATVMADGGIFLGKQIVRPGDKEPPDSETFFRDGERVWRLTHDYDDDDDDASSGFRWNLREVDPATGKPLRQSVPPWFEETEGGEIAYGFSELIPAPAGTEGSPLGTNDGMIGWKAVKRRDGSHYGEGVDGRRWDKPLIDGTFPAAVPVGLLCQPGTNAFLPVSTRGDDRTGSYQLWDPSGSTIVAELKDFGSDFAAGQAALLPLHFWHLLKPRHEASSKKLRATSLKQCEAFFKAAAEAREEAAAQRRKRNDDELQGGPTKVLPAVKEFLPKAPERMAMGIAQVIESAEQEAMEFTTLREKVVAESRGESDRSSLIVNQRVDQAANRWRKLDPVSYYDDRDISTCAHLTEAAAFLKGESKGGELPSTNCAWFSMLDGLPLHCWQTFWGATATKMARKDDSEIAWLEFLEFWQELGIADLPGQFATMEGCPEGIKKQQLGALDIARNPGRAFTIRNGDDLFIAIEIGSYSDPPYCFLRYSTSKTPAPPPGYRVENVRKIKNSSDREQVAAFIEAARSCTELPLPSKEEIEEMAATLSVLPAEIGLVWMGGLKLDSHENSFLPSELRKAWGWKASEASAARQSLRNLDAKILTQLFTSVVAKGMSVPFADDRTPSLRSIEKTWRAKVPKRLSIDAVLQKRLSSLGQLSKWDQRDEQDVLEAAAAPTKHPLLQPCDTEIRAIKGSYRGGVGLKAKRRNQEAIAFDSILTIVRLVGMVHGETPAGHPARAEIPPLIKQTNRLLDSPKTLLDLLSIFIHEHDPKKTTKPSEWITKVLGKTKADAKQGIVRFDDGLIVAAALDSDHHAFVGFRPLKLKDQSDMPRLRGLLAVDIDDGFVSVTDSVPVVATIKGPGFQKLAKAILAKNVPDGGWPQNPNHTAPAVVEEIQKKHELGDDASVLYAQLLALPDPTSKKLRAWNDWAASRLKKASAELLGKKLVLEAKRARAGRAIFLPGEWTELKAPWLPIETWKLPHLIESELDAGVFCPVGGPMVLRPFEDLFAAAWGRVLGGDKPRYEEVKRKRKKQ